MKEISIYEKMTNAEKEVAELLKDLGIKWSYEHPVFVWDENKRPRVENQSSGDALYLQPNGKPFTVRYLGKKLSENGKKVLWSK